MYRTDQQPKKSVCNNCGKYGHHFHQCRSPATSYGIIAFRNHPEHGRQYLMVRRRDSFGYIDFVGGKYATNTTVHIRHLIDEMTAAEKHRILTSSFRQLKGNAFAAKPMSAWKNDDICAQRKFDYITGTGVELGVGGRTATLSDMVNESGTAWAETEWEFPKGRRNSSEKDLTCAVREFEEESGYTQDNMHVLRNILPLEETFIGSNYMAYKNKYYVAFMDEIVDTAPNTPHAFEVSKVEWKTYDECIASIRPYNVEKREVIAHVHQMIERTEIQRSYVPVY
jgi:8-oxo-dGTP pyrophosphatase MutT (NUDIX family)